MLLKAKIAPNSLSGGRPDLMIGSMREVPPEDGDWQSPWLMNLALLPTAKGVSLVVLRLPDLAKAINKALERARTLGLLPDDGGEA